MTSRPALDADALLSSDETEALPALLADVSQGHGAGPAVRDAASAASSLLGNRAANQGGYAPTRDGSRYEQLLARMRNRSRPWHTDTR
jgi:hypothetical protein